MSLTPSPPSIAQPNPQPIKSQFLPLPPPPLLMFVATASVVAAGCCCCYPRYACLLLSLHHHHNAARRVTVSPSPFRAAAQPHHNPILIHKHSALNHAPHAPGAYTLASRQTRAHASRHSPPTGRLHPPPQSTHDCNASAATCSHSPSTRLYRWKKKANKKEKRPL